VECQGFADEDLNTPPFFQPSGPANGSFNDRHLKSNFLAVSTSRTPKQGLNLLGIDVPERM
jgi:hypothetical protein